MKINLSKVLGLSVLALTVSLSGVLTGCAKKSNHNHNGESVVDSSFDSGVLIGEKETLVDLFNVIDCVDGELRTKSGYKVVFEKDGKLGDVSCSKPNN